MQQAAGRVWRCRWRKGGETTWYGKENIAGERLGGECWWGAALDGFS